MNLQKKKIINKDIEKRDFKRGGEVSSKLKSILRKLGVSTDIIRKSSIISYELEMNIIIHSEGGNISAFISPDRIQICAEDEGPGIKDIDKALKPGFSTAEDNIRELGFGAGMGLNNVDKYSDKMKIKSSEDEGTKVEVFLKL